MKSIKNTEQFIRAGKTHIVTGRGMDDKTLQDSFEAMTQAVGNGMRPDTMIVRSILVKLAAVAAVAIIAIGLFMAHRNPDGSAGVNGPYKAKGSPTRLLTAASLSLTYRKGGMEAMDKQYRQALESLGPRPRALTVKQLLAEQNRI